VRYLFHLVLACVAAAVPLCAQQRKPLSAVDLLSWKTIEAVELSPDGEQVIYSLKERDWKQNRFAKSLWIVRTDGQSQPVRFTDSEKDDSPKWAPDGRRVAFVSSREGAPQIWIVDRAGGAPEKLTNVPGSVISFSWAPDGKRIGLIARSPKKGSYEEGAKNKDAEIVINKWDFVIYKLLSSSVFLELDQSNELWLADVTNKRGEPAVTDVHVTQFAWSPDSRRIGVVFQAQPGFTTQRSDAMIYSIDTKQSQVILRGTGGQSWDDSAAYTNPMWSPDGKGLALMYRNASERWQAQSQLGIYRLSESKFVPVPGSDRLVLYNPKFTWIDEGRMFMENTASASRGLFSLSLTTGGIEPVAEHHSGDSRFSFSKDAKTMAFVRESARRPPDVYLSRAPFSASRPLTSLNAALAGASLPKIERVHWKSSDDAEVEGWLSTPDDFGPDRTYPLIVMVHGGPGYAVSDDFDMYIEWPYPYRMAPARGYLVLMPNYRGTGSYSAAFSKPSDVAKEPVDDIVTGIQYLVGRGFVDKTRIGIAGHSHGSWLGPQVLVTHPELFRAASFAEGGVDLISAYGQMPGWLNLNIHDYYYHGAPFQSREHYVAISPIFHTAGLTTPTLLEFGEQSLAAQGMEFQTALWRCGVPNELIIYPKTGHNMSRPQQEAESMARNMDWFDYWMLGKEDADASKQEQYKRWKTMTQEMQTMRKEHPCVASPGTR
jgi:dipeptidyl aminopeptidase/acylaminoacyl peptidase